jgi:hypothetical protein
LVWCLSSVFCRCHFRSRSALGRKGWPGSATNRHGRPRYVQGGKGFHPPFGALRLAPPLTKYLALSLTRSLTYPPTLCRPYPPPPSASSRDEEEKEGTREEWGGGEWRGYNSSSNIGKAAPAPPFLPTCQHRHPPPPPPRPPTPRP